MISARSTLVGFATARGFAASYLLLDPDRCAGTLARGERLPPSAVVRLLGVRTLCQSAVVAVAPTRRVALVTAVIDALHEGSMVVAGLLLPDYRDTAFASGTEAAAASCVGGIAARALP